MIFLRKAAPIFFLIVICMPFASTHFLFKIRQRSIHTKVKESKTREENKGKLVLLKIPKSEARQPEIFEQTDEFEIRYKGKMYDLSKFEVHGDYTLYWGIWDVEETDLENKFKEIKNKGTGAHGISSEDVLTHFMNTLYFKPYEPEGPIYAIFLTLKPLQWGSVSVTRTESPPTPPPKA